MQKQAKRPAWLRVLALRILAPPRSDWPGLLIIPVRRGGAKTGMFEPMPDEKMASLEWFLAGKASAQLRIGDSGAASSIKSVTVKDSNGRTFRKFTTAWPAEPDETLIDPSDGRFWLPADASAPGTITVAYSHRRVRP